LPLQRAQLKVDGVEKFFALLFSLCSECWVSKSWLLLMLLLQAKEMVVLLA
jgi:hypothetical protein